MKKFQKQVNNKEQMFFASLKLLRFHSAARSCNVKLSEFLTCYSLHCYSQKSSDFSFLANNSYSVNQRHRVQQVAQVHKRSGKRKERKHKERQAIIRKSHRRVWLAGGTLKSSQSTLLQLLDLQRGHGCGLCGSGTANRRHKTL